MPRASSHHHREEHRLERLAWLRAAVLGANDGIVSIASLLVGVAGAGASREQIALAGVAALVAGAMSMATGEYVSVSSQADTERAALAKERIELDEDYAGEERELTGIYMRRGVDADVARSVATQLMRHDALGAHARDELGVSEATSARPLQAAFASAASFALGGLVPLAVALVVPIAATPWVTALASLLCLGVLGGVAAAAGGAVVRVGVVRVTTWSTIAMGVTYAVGRAFGTVA